MHFTKRLPKNIELSHFQRLAFIYVSLYSPYIVSFCKERISQNPVNIQLNEASIKLHTLLCN